MYRYGYEDPAYYGWHYGRHLRLHRRMWDPFWGPGGGYGYGFGHRDFYDYGVAPLKEYLEWLKVQKANIEREITDIESTLKDEQAK